MCTILREGTPVARKNYCCDASDWIMNSDVFSDCTFKEKRQIVIAQRNGWKIKKGDKYTYQVNIWSGDFNVFKAITAMHDICVNYDLYQED